MTVDIESAISRVGWAVQIVFPAMGEGDQHFAYTLGLTRKGFPELLFMLPVTGRTVNLIIQSIVNQWDDKGVHFGKVRLWEGVNCDLVPVNTNEAREKYCVQLCQLYSDFDPRVQIVQVLLPDKRGRLPDEKGYYYPRQDLSLSKRYRNNVLDFNS